MTKQNKFLRILLVLAIAGLVLSIYSYLQHTGVASSTICTINETFNCDIVNRGPYGTFMGLPVSLIGVIGYGLLVAGFAEKLRKPAEKELTRFLLMASLAGLLFALYLTGIEMFVLHAYCVICLMSQAVILAIVGLTTSVWFLEKKT